MLKRIDRKVKCQDYGPASEALCVCGEGGGLRMTGHEAFPPGTTEPLRGFRLMFICMRCERQTAIEIMQDPDDGHKTKLFWRTCRPA